MKLRAIGQLSHNEFTALFDGDKFEVSDFEGEQLIAAGLARLDAPDVPLKPVAAKAKS